jgi:hypothetical protein
MLVLITVVLAGVLFASLHRAVDSPSPHAGFEPAAAPLRPAGE